MAKQDLNNLRDFIHDTLKKKSLDYRKAVSDKEIHAIRISSKEIQQDIKAELEARGATVGANKRLAPSLVSIIEDEVPKFCSKMYNMFENYNADRKKSFVSELKGSKTEFTFNLVPKVGGTVSIFNAFLKIKQEAQRPLITKLKKQINSLNTGRKSGNQIKNINTRFLDVGHEEGSAVVSQRKVATAKALYRFGTGNEAIQRDFRKRIEGLGIDIKIEKSKGLPMTIGVSLESKTLNSAKGGSSEAELAANLQKDLQKVLAEIDSNYWVNQEGSNSAIMQANIQLLNSFARVGRNKNVRTNIKEQKVKNKASKSSPRKRGKAVAATGKKDTTIEKLPTFDISNKQSMFRFVALINQKLTETVKKNMNSPALQNQTGRFAESVKVMEVTQTRQGYPSFGYRYQNRPYQVFEMGKGSPPWATPERDPRRLIEGSIREVAATLALGRFYTRRL